VLLFKPIRTTADLPKPGPTTRAAESHGIDFKKTYDPGNRREMAKDVAAFANAFGGVLLIGTTEDGEPLDYPGAEREFVERLSQAFDDAHGELLSPKPFIERVLVYAPASDGRVLLAVNVHPFPDQIIGARLDKDGWRFPMRVGARTQFVEPAMLPLYTAEIRRTMILLSGIDPLTGKAQLCHRNPRNQTNPIPSYADVRVAEIDVSQNRATLERVENGGRIYIPLNDIELVWHNGSAWVIKVAGFVDERCVYHSNPSNTVMRM
jgi:hypothetical protein